MSTDIKQSVPARRRMKQPGSGRAVGTPNKVTRAVREVLARVFNELQAMDGGVPKYPGANMFEWALREPGEFYKLAARLIPTEINGNSGGGGLTVLLTQFNDIESQSRKLKTSG